MIRLAPQKLQVRAICHMYYPFNTFPIPLQNMVTTIVPSSLYAFLSIYLKDKKMTQTRNTTPYYHGKHVLSKHKGNIYKNLDIS